MINEGLSVALFTVMPQMIHITGLLRSEGSISQYVGQTFHICYLSGAWITLIGPATHLMYIYFTVVMPDGRMIQTWNCR